MATEISYLEQEERILQDEFRHVLQSCGQTLVRHRGIYSDPSVLKQRWLVTPGSKTYTKKAFYLAFDQTKFRQALRFLVANSTYTLDQIASLALNVEQFTFLEEQDFLMRLFSGKREEADLLAFTALDTHKKCWKKGSACQNIANIGHTLEWYVAEWFRNEYHALARHGVETKELISGDLDVVAFKDGMHIMVECKSSSQIEEQKLSLFLQRSASFQPDMTLLLIDTESAESVEARTKKLCELLALPYEPKYKQLHGKTTFRWIPRYNIYITNTGASIAATLRAVLHLHNSLAQMRRPH